MKIIDVMKKIILAFLGCVAITSACAQETKVEGESSTEEEIITDNDKYKVETNHFFDNWFISLGAGPQVFFGDHDKQVKFFHRLSPALDIAVGKWFTPGVGVRMMYSGLSIKGATQKGALSHSTGVDVPGKGGNGYWLEKQKFSYYHAHVDVLFNFSNLFYGYNENRIWNCSPYIGLGWTRVWEAPQTHEVSASIGVLNSFRLNKAWDFNMDIRGAFVNDRFDGEEGNRWGEGLWSMTFGFTYKFKPRGWSKSKTIIRTNQHEVSALRSELENVNLEKARLEEQLANRERDSLLVVKQIAVANLVVFKIDTWDLTDEARVNLGMLAETIKQSDADVVYTVTGYADAGTGSKKRNEKLSKNRAQVVYDCLTKEFGVPESQLRIEYKGGVGNMFYNDPRLSRAVITKAVVE